MCNLLEAEAGGVCTRVVSGSAGRSAQGQARDQVYFALLKALFAFMRFSVRLFVLTSHILYVESSFCCALGILSCAIYTEYSRLNGWDR